MKLYAVEVIRYVDGNVETEILEDSKTVNLHRANKAAALEQEKGHQTRVVVVCDTALAR